MRDERAARHFDAGLLELERYLRHLDEAVLRGSADEFGRAVDLSPEDVRYRAALGFVLDAAARRDEAIVVLREAHRLDPTHREVEVLLATLLAESGAEEEALAAITAAAARQDRDVDSVRRQLEAAGMPTDARTLILNTFNHARNFPAIVARAGDRPGQRVIVAEEALPDPPGHGFSAARASARGAGC